MSRFEIDTTDPAQVAAFMLGAAVMGGLLTMALAVRAADEARARAAYWAEVQARRMQLARVRTR